MDHGRYGRKISEDPAINPAKSGAAHWVHPERVKFQKDTPTNNPGHNPFSPKRKEQHRCIYSFWTEPALSPKKIGESTQRCKCESLSLSLHI